MRYFSQVNLQLIDSHEQTYCTFFIIITTITFSFNSMTRSSTINCNFNIILQILTQLPVILKEEEDEAYNNEVGLSESEDIINKQHNDAVRTIAIGHIVEKVVYGCTVKSIHFFIFDLVCTCLDNITLR